MRTAGESGNSPEVIKSTYRGLATEADGERYFQITPDLVQRVGKGEPHLNLRPIESAAIDLAHSALLLRARCQKQELETDYQNATGVWRLNPSL